MEFLNIEDIEKASKVLKDEEVLAFPTETVYGLAAPLSAVDTIKKIYTLKQRPQENPLIVHVLGVEQLQWVAEVTPLVLRLVKHFWPGPLTLELKKKPVCQLA